MGVSFQGGGQGQITVDHGVLNCTEEEECAWESDADGAPGPLTMTAEPEDGSVFVGWSGGGCLEFEDAPACHVSATCTIDDPTTGALLVAQFDEASATPLTIAFEAIMGTLGEGTVTASCGELVCDAEGCTGSQLPWDDVVLTPQAEPGSVFLGWAGTCPSENADGSCTVDMYGGDSHQLRAIFERDRPLSTVTPSDPLTEGECTSAKQRLDAEDGDAHVVGTRVCVRDGALMTFTDVKVAEENGVYDLTRGEMARGAPLSGGCLRVPAAAP